MHGSGKDELAPIVKALTSGRCVLCLGGELASDGSLRRLVGKLLESLPDATEAQALLERRPLMAADYVRRQLGDGFAAALLEATASTQVPELLAALGGLPFSAVVTTSYDGAVERAFARHDALPPIFTPRDHAVPSFHGRLRFVYKLLGDPTQPETVVWGAADLQAALAAGAYRGIAEELFKERSFLFLGFDWADAELSLFLERVLSATGRGAVEHYALLPGLSRLERWELQSIYGIRVLREDDVGQVIRALAATMADAQRALPAHDDLDGWLALLADDPGRADAADRLASIEAKLRAIGDHAHLVELYVGRTAVEPKPARRAALLHLAARVLDKDLGDPARALSAMLAAYKEGPTRGAWEALDRLADASGNWGELQAELAARAVALPVADRAEAWVRIAAIREAKLDDPSGALAASDAALAIAPHHPEALRQRLAALRRAERWRELADTLGRCVLLEESLSRRGELYAELAELFDTRLSDPAQAIACYGLALDADPGATRAGLALEALLLRRGDIGALIGVLDHRARRSSGHEQVAIRRQIAELCEQRLGDRRLAIDHLERLRAASPNDLVTLRELARLYELEGRLSALLEVLMQAVAYAESERERVELLQKVAVAWERQPGGNARAIECLEQALAIEPGVEPALIALERLLRAEARHEELVAALRRHVPLAAEHARVLLHLQIAGVCESALQDLDGAMAAYEQALALDPEQAESLEGLARIFEGRGEYERAIALHERHAAQWTGVAKVESLFRAGELASERLDDPDRAEALYMRVLAIDANHVPSLLGLSQLYLRRGDMLRFAKLLTEAVAKSPNRLVRTRLLIEAGASYQRLDDREHALALYRRALEEDPEHADAAERASELLWQDESYAELVPLLDMLARKQAASPALVERLSRLAVASRAIGDIDGAQRAFRRALSIEPGHLDALRGLGSVLFQAGNFAEAREVLLSLLDQHEADLLPDEQVEVQHRLGVCELRSGRPDAARERFAIACAIDPTHRPSRLAQLELGNTDPLVAIDAKKALLATAAKHEQLVLYMEIGDLYLDRLEDPVHAAGAWEAGLAVEPGDVRLLHRCLNVFVEQKAWSQVLAVLEKLIRNEDKPQMRAKYHLTSGVVCLENLGKFAEAADHLWASIEEDPTNKRTAAVLEQMLRNHKSWKELVRYYKFAIRRLEPVSTPEKRAEQQRLWLALGEVSLDKLRDLDNAIVAFEVAFSLDQASATRVRLAALYATVGRDEEAILAHQALLIEDKARIASYQALEELYKKTARPARAATYARAIDCLASDASAPQGLVDRDLPQPRRALTPVLYARLRHPSEDLQISALFAAVAPVVAAARAQRDRTPLARKQLLLADDTRRIARVLRRAAASLGMPMPNAYVVPEQAESFSLVCTIDGRLVVPVLRIGRPMLEDRRSERELSFEIGRRLAQLTPEHFIRWLAPSTRELAHLIEAAVALADEHAGHKPIGEIAKTADGYKRELPAAVLDSVASLGAALRQRELAPEPVARRWIQASDLSCSRVALVLAGDVVRCARLLKHDPHPQAAWLPPAQRVLDLIWSSTTEEVFAAREHLGLAD